MAKAPEINVEQIFAPETDLATYETMEWRDMYLALMKGVFAHQSLPTDENTLTPSFGGMYVAATEKARTTTDDEITIGEGDTERQVRVETGAVAKAYAGVDWPWGPLASVTLSTVEDGKIIKLGAGTSQQRQDLFLGASLSVLDPLTGKPTREDIQLVRSAWAGNTDNTSEPTLPREIIKEAESLFRRDITVVEKRVVGVTLEGLGQLALVRAS